jgi:coproporphyrinogen III oxidase-like Fe-S oxidoreductase
LGSRNGYTSIGHDIIFWIAFQEIEDVIDTIEKTKSLQPDWHFIVTLTFLGLKAMDSAVLTTKTFQKMIKENAL